MIVIDAISDDKTTQHGYLESLKEEISESDEILTSGRGNTQRSMNEDLETLRSNLKSTKASQKALKVVNFNSHRPLN